VEGDVNVMYERVCGGGWVERHYEVKGHAILEWQLRGYVSQDFTIHASDEECFPKMWFAGYIGSISGRFKVYEGVDYIAKAGWVRMWEDGEVKADSVPSTT